MPDLTYYLQHLRWRYRLLDSWLLTQNTLPLALFASALVLLAGRFLPFELRTQWSLLPLATWLLLILAHLILRPYPDLSIARRADENLNLYERLSTAWVLSQPDLPSYAQFSTEWVLAQRQDALQAAASIQPAKPFPSLAAPSLGLFRPSNRGHPADVLPAQPDGRPHPRAPRHRP